jgi:hypothetical protein
MVGKILGPRLKDINNHIFVANVQEKPTPEKWLGKFIYADQEVLRDLYVRDGMVAMLTPTLWGNDSLIYRLRQDDNNCNKDGQPLYRLYITVAPGRGWDMIKTCLEHTEGDCDKEFLDTCSFVSDPVTLEDGQKLIMEDAQKRCPRVVADQNPYWLDDGKNDIGVWKKNTLYYPILRARKFVRDTFPWFMNPERLHRKLNDARRALRTMRKNKAHYAFKVRFSHALKHMDWKEMSRSLVLVAAINLPIAGLLWLTLSVFSPVLFLASRFSTQSAQRVGHQLIHGMNRGNRVNSPDREKLLRKVCVDWTRSRLRALLDKKWLPYFAIRTYDNLHTDIGANKKIHDKPPAEWAVHYIADSIQDPPGSVSVPLQLGEHYGMHVIAPNGHRVTYLPSIGVTFGRMDWTYTTEAIRRTLTPDAVLDLYKTMPADKPFIMVEQVPNQREPNHYFLSSHDFQSELLRISRIPAMKQDLFPEKMPDIEEPPPSSPPSLLQRAWALMEKEGGATVAETGLDKLGGFIEHGPGGHLPGGPSIHPH